MENWREKVDERKPGTSEGGPARGQASQERKKGLATAVRARNRKSNIIQPRLLNDLPTL